MARGDLKANACWTVSSMLLLSNYIAIGRCMCDGGEEIEGKRLYAHTCICDVHVGEDRVISKKSRNQSQMVITKLVKHGTLIIVIAPYNVISGACASLPE